MIAAFLVFVLVTAAIVGVYLGLQALSKVRAERRLELRLMDVSSIVTDDTSASVVVPKNEGPLEAIDRVLVRVPGFGGISHLVVQSGVKTTPAAVGLASVGCACAAAVVTSVFVRQPFAWPLAAAAGLALPTIFLMRKRSMRIARFEEQFPDALDLMARAIRAGHAFQTALGMVADELTAPVGPEFKKAFEEQNFGLPLRDALNGLAERTPLLDIRFFVTAVTIQRESGGNLSEILENLAHVVRERFKIRRQVRTHTAHGRFTGYVLLALPAALAVALSSISPDQMQLLFREHMGQMMLGGAVVLQTIGYFWIRQVIKIEV
jgi:tight adherence protein B